MDTGTGITALIFLVFCIIVFLLIARSGREKEKALLKALEKLAAAGNCRLTVYDSWHSGAIAIDTAGTHVFAIQHIDGHITPLSFSLAELQNCKPVRTARSGPDNQGSFSEMQRLDLLFGFKDSEKPDSTLNFYLADTDGYTLNGELQLIEKWNRIINNRLDAKAIKK